MGAWRITPAHAGTSFASSPSFDRKRDHPRTRGDKLFERSHNHADKGSPPHTRGQVCLLSLAYFFLRITPAHAGTSVPPLLRHGGGEDHPRTRGDKIWCVV